MLEPANGFDWDTGNVAKCRKHGVALEEIEALFRGEFDVFPDMAHSSTETRFFGIGRAPTGRYLFVAFALRTKENQRLIRPISARFMHSKEVKYYEAEAARRKNR